VLLEEVNSPRLFFSLFNTTVTGVTVSPAYAILIALAIAFALASLCAIAYYGLFKKPVYDNYNHHQQSGMQAHVGSIPLVTFFPK
jgi:hypothetical protein